MKNVFLVLLLTQSCFAQEQQPPIENLNVLIGKQVIAQRMPLCEPGSYKLVMTFVGKQARVLSVKPSPIAELPQGNISKLSPQTRAMIEDQRKAATVTVQFEDGTQLESCGPITPNRLSDYFDIVPGQAISTGKVELADRRSTVPTNLSPISKPTTSASDTLSDDEVRSAVSGYGKNHWVEISDMGLGASGGNQWPSITLYLPDAVLAIQGESARKQFIQFEPSQEQKKRSLMIVAEGWAGKTITEGCTSITRIMLLSDQSGGSVKEAYLSEPLDETWRNNLGATNKCQALRAKFTLADVQQVKNAARNGEFFVAVFSGSTNTKMYKVKRKFQSKLGLD